MAKITITECPLCGCKELDPTMTCVDQFATGEMFHLVKCHNCHFLMTQGVPDESEIGRYYEAPDYISHTDTHKGLINTLYHHVRKYMLQRKASLIKHETRKETGHLLDYGAGTGYFANTMKQHGWQVDAIELSDAARKFAADNFQINIQPTEALDTLVNGSYDVITLWHVMEHLQDLDKIWNKFYDLLTDKGLLIIAVPNYTSHDARHYKAYWAAYDVPRHLWHFSPEILQQFGSKYGFILAERYPMPFDAFYVSMLTEKQMRHNMAFIRGLSEGCIAWFDALMRKDRSSSLIYVFRKK